MVRRRRRMFAAPTLIVAGAPWQPLLDGLPGRLGRSATREVMRGGWSRPLRALGGAARRPWVAVALFNISMLAWHVPALFDLGQNNQTAPIWLMHASFFITGVLFWLQFISSPPFRMRMLPIAQVAALAATNGIMWILAMSRSIITSGSWYPVYNHIPGVTLAPFAGQQISAGILWGCGGFWAIPAVIVVMRRLIAEDGSVSAAVHRMLGRGTAGTGWAGRSRGPRRAMDPPRS